MYIYKEREINCLYVLQIEWYDSTRTIHHDVLSYLDGVLCAGCILHMLAYWIKRDVIGFERYRLSHDNLCRRYIMIEIEWLFETSSVYDIQ